MEEKTANERLVSFCQAKQEALGVENYFTSEDAAELLSWEVEDAEEVLEKIVNHAKFVFLDYLVCPWCVLHHNKCDACYYGDRHGCCEDYQSDYYKIIAGGQASIVSLLSEEKLRELVNKYLKEEKEKEK